MGTLWAFTGTGLGLTLFGVIYNAITDWLERRGRHEGYTALLVVGGVLVTVAASALLVGIQAALTVGFCFVCSGTPMIVGSIYRHVMLREKERAEERETVWRMLDEHSTDTTPIG